MYLFEGREVEVGTIFLWERNCETKK
jgi:hypothetical protein